ncbi:hypothetical protein [Pseudomonas sp. MF6751]|uniref:hypothetical protein n=1 Tax=Pseudomonas sp. MF6751 TaxID=2797528 RepID=UPI001F179A05|nr:hypothetical protein [Pseudomonas sp. MF6751]
MTTNQTIDGVPRATLSDAFDELPDWNTPAATKLRALLDAPICKTPSGAECHGDGVGPCKKCPAVQPQPDPVLCKFYDVTDWPGLVRELVGHVAQLQDSAKRNVKPWEDTFPPTLLPAYIERVNAENSAAQPQGEPVAWQYEFGGKWYNGDDRIKGHYKNTVEAGYPVRSLYAGQPAPVAVVPDGFMLVERGIWTEEQVDSAAKCIAMLKGVPGMTDRDLAMAAMDAGQCKAPDITLSDIACIDDVTRLNAKSR